MPPKKEGTKQINAVVPTVIHTLATGKHPSFRHHFEIQSCAMAGCFWFAVRANDEERARAIRDAELFAADPEGWLAENADAHQQLPPAKGSGGKLPAKTAKAVGKGR